MRKFIHSYHKGMLIVGMALLSGCSSFHNVSIGGHGNESAEESVDSFPPGVSHPPGSETESDSSFPVVSEPATPPVVSPSIRSSISAQSADDSLLPWTLEDIFFDYDQYIIRRNSLPSLEQNAQVLLKRYPTREIIIEGHCDERGTEEYNLILGERRARMVKNYLVDLGVPSSNLRVLTLGKNEPFCLQTTLACFQQNRRAHFVLK